MVAGYGLSLNLEKVLRSISRYRIASGRIAKKKLVQVALKTVFQLRKDKLDKDSVVKIATVDELKKSGFKKRFEVGNN